MSTGVAPIPLLDKGNNQKVRGIYQGMNLGDIVLDAGVGPFKLPDLAEVRERARRAFECQHRELNRNFSAMLRCF